MCVIFIWSWKFECVLINLFNVIVIVVKCEELKYLSVMMGEILNDSKVVLDFEVIVGIILFICIMNCKFLCFYF